MSEKAPPARMSDEEFDALADLFRRLDTYFILKDAVVEEFVSEARRAREWEMTWQDRTAVAWESLAAKDAEIARLTKELRISNNCNASLGISLTEAEENYEAAKRLMTLPMNETYMALFKAEAERDEAITALSAHPGGVNQTLRAERDALRAALERIDGISHEPGQQGNREVQMENIGCIAREALK
jgi:hypothetical protein